MRRVRRRCTESSGAYCARASRRNRKRSRAAAVAAHIEDRATYFVLARMNMLVPQLVSCAERERPIASSACVIVSPSESGRRLAASRGRIVNGDSNAVPTLELRRDVTKRHSLEHERSARERDVAVERGRMCNRRGSCVGQVRRGRLPRARSPDPTESALSATELLDNRHFDDRLARLRADAEARADIADETALSVHTKRARPASCATSKYASPSR